MKAKIGCLAMLTVLLTTALAFAQGLPTAKPEQVGLSSERLGRLMSTLRNDVEKGEIPGAIVLIARHGRIAWFEAVGMRDPQAKTAMTKDSIFRIYSMTKPITSVAAMMLVEEGKLGLGDPVSKYIPQLGKAMKVAVEKTAADGTKTVELVPTVREMTIHDLFRHSAGLTYGFFGDTPAKRAYLEKNVGRDPDITNAEIMDGEYAADPATAAVTSGSYREVARVETLDSHTVKVVFNKPQPFWSDALCGNRGMIIPKHLFEPYRGAKSREAPTNLKPVGTGPYRFVDFKPGDVVRGEIHASYHVANRPFFDQIEMKGGGDAVSAARAVLQTGEYDYAWNMQVEDEILRRLEQGGKGRINFWPTGNPEHIQCNFSDPWTEVDGERGSAKTTHPLLSDRAVRQALNLLVDRAAVQEQIYGRQGQTSANFLNAPSRFFSKNTRWEFNVDKANQILEAAGWKRGPDGVRAKDGKRLKMVYQTSINAPRQKNQQIVKQAAARAGIDLELKSVTSSVFFSSDPANLDTYPHFAADLQMYNTTMTSPDPQYFMNQFTSWEVASKANKWQGRNVTRWRSEEYDQVYNAADTELDPVKRAALFIKMNDLVIQDAVVIPVLWRSGVSASAARLKGMDLTGWDSTFWRLPYWYKQA